MKQMVPLPSQVCRPAVEPTQGHLTELPPQPGGVGGNNPDQRGVGVRNSIVTGSLPRTDLLHAQRRGPCTEAWPAVCTVRLSEALEGRALPSHSLSGQLLVLVCISSPKTFLVLSTRVMRKLHIQTHTQTCVMCVCTHTYTHARMHTHIYMLQSENSSFLSSMSDFDD